MEHVNVGDLRIGYRRAGQGPVLLLLHGGVCDSRVWRVEIDAFADTFTVVAWDAPGCGSSSDAPEDFRMGDYGAVLEGFIEELDLGSPHVLGHSWGSTLALELCLRRPLGVRSLVLVGAYAGWAGSLPATEVERRLDLALRAAEMGPGGFEFKSMPGLFSDVMPRDRVSELETIMSEVRPGATRSMAFALAETDLRDALPSIVTPTLLLVGDADVRSPVAVAEELRRSIPGSTMVVLPGVGHECFLESPNTFERAVREFLLQHV